MVNSVLLKRGHSGVPVAELAGAASSWRKADGYYFRGIARMQRLWEVCHRTPPCKVNHISPDLVSTQI